MNFFGGSPLNRLAWLRTSQPFLNAIAHAPATRWVLFKDGQPLVQSKPSAPTLSLARLTTNDVKALLGSEPYFAQGQHAGDLAPPDVPALEAARLRGNGVVFLGLHETNRSHADALPSSDFSAKTSADVVLSNIKGTAYFSLDVSNVAQSELDETLQNAAAAKEGDRIVFSEPRTATASFDAFDAAVFAEARSMTDWNARNKVRPHARARGDRRSRTEIYPTAAVLSGVRIACALAVGRLEALVLVASPMGGKSRGPEAVHHLAGPAQLCTPAHGRRGDYGSD